MNKILICLFLAILLGSCDDGSKSLNLKLDIDVVMNRDDSLHVYYKTDGTIDFNEDESLWVKVKGQNKNQRVTIQFPGNVVPNQIRIDFSKKKQQKEIVLNKVEFSYLKNSFVAKGKEIYKYFRIDESNTLLNKELGILTRKDTTNKVGPSLYPNGYYLAVKLDELKFKK